MSKRPHKRWVEDDLHWLLCMVSNETSDKDAAAFLNRTVSSVCQARVRRFEIRYIKEPWTPEKSREATRKWANANRDKISAYTIKYRAENAEKIRIYGQRHWAENKEKLSAVFSEWRKANLDKRAATERKRRAKKFSALGDLTAEEFAAICKKQKGKCAICGLKAKLAADHIIPISRGGSNYACNIQGLCQSCNSSKGARIEPGSQHTLFDKHSGREGAE